MRTAMKRAPVGRAQRQLEHGLEWRARCAPIAGRRRCRVRAGVIGLLVIQLVHSAGAGLVIGIDRIASRRELASRLGADLVVDPTEGDSW